jgi:sugar (pentulose or hexulose) kinase
MYILSLDYGTSSLKLSVLDEELKTVRSASVPYGYHVENNDWITIDSDLVYKSLVEGMKKLADLAGKIEIIAYDTFSPSLTFMDQDGNPLHPIITHLDRRAKEQSRQIRREMGAKEYQAITGIFPFTGGARR